MGKLKKIFSEKVLALVLVLIALGVTYYFYQQGKISFLPKKERTVVNEFFAAQIPFTDKEYKLSYYKDKAGLAFDIANFEENESWFGEGEFDYSTFFEGESSMFLTSLGGQKASVTLKKNFDIADVLNFKFIVYLATDPANIEEFNLVFGGSNLDYKFPIRDLRQGWNLLLLPKEKFSQGQVSAEVKGELTTRGSIQKVLIELVSRPKTRSIVNLDSLWAEKEDKYLQDWHANSDKFLSIKENKDAVNLLAVGLFGTRATLKKGAAKNYTLQAKFTPAKGGSFGFFLRGDYKSGYGYYFIMGGRGTNTWQIYKYGFFEEKSQAVDLAKGEISNFQMEKNKPYWLKAELKGSRLNFYLSVDGENFVKLGETTDESFVSGGVGIFSSGESMFFVDELWFFQ